MTPLPCGCQQNGNVWQLCDRHQQMNRDLEAGIAIVERASRVFVKEESSYGTQPSAGSSDAFRHLSLPPAAQLTWEDVEREALTCPVLAATVHQVRRGIVPREYALMAAVVFMSKERRERIDREVQRLREQPSDLKAWLTRGLADKAAVADALRTLMGAAASGPYLAHLEKAIDALNDKMPKNPIV
jgi:hypothetical protein